MIWLNGAASESNQASVGLPRRTGLKVRGRRLARLVEPFLARSPAGRSAQVGSDGQKFGQKFGPGVAGNRNEAGWRAERLGHSPQPDPTLRLRLVVCLA